jgi:hypothetical protein
MLALSFLGEALKEAARGSMEVPPEATKIRDLQLEKFLQVSILTQRGSGLGLGAGRGSREEGLNSRRLIEGRLCAVLCCDVLVVW